jgi:RND family efflux transporter MFP subunit
MLIVLSIYFLLVWLIFIKLQLLPWNRAWKTVIYGIAAAVALVVVGALQYYTPSSTTAVVQNDTQNIFPLVGGRVESVEVTGTQSVTAGELLFTLDARPFQYNVNQTAAALELARIRLRDATTLVEKQAVARATIDLYKAEFDQAQAVYDSAVYNLENTRIVAPANGIVSIVTLYEGEVVAAMKPVMNFFHTDHIRIASTFKQNGMEKLVPGMLATVVFSAAPGEIFEAKIAVIPPVSLQGQLTTEAVSNPLDALMSSTGQYPVLISFPAEAPEHLLRSGTQASVTVFTDEDNPINILAKILQFFGTWMNFVF